MDEAKLRQIIREELRAAVVPAERNEPVMLAPPMVTEFLDGTPPGEYRAAELYERFQRMWLARVEAPSATWFGRHVILDPRVTRGRRATARFYIVRALPAAEQGSQAAA